jgi:5'-3' exonuclease
MTKHVLIDADPLAYRAVFSASGDTIGGVIEKVDQLFTHIFDGVCEKFGNNLTYKAYLTGSGNFRKEIAKDYKANRVGEKPALLGFARDYIENTYDTVITEGEEADDAIAIAATKLYPNTIIVSIDKDFKQVPCLLFNPSKDEWSDIDDWSGTLSFYTQMLVGDTVDNIKGVWKVGPAKAKKILDGATTELELWQRCLEAYEGDYNRAVTNGRLLWLRREENQMWTPPVG